MASTINQLMTVSDVCAELSLSKSTIWRRVKDGTLPAPIKISERATRWFRSDIEAHLQSLRGPSDADKKARGEQ